MFDNELEMKLAEVLGRIFLDIETIKFILVKNDIVSKKEFEAIQESLSSVGERKRVMNELNELKERMKKEE